MLRVRATGIVIKDNCVLLMERIKEGKHYWTFPGGGVGADETVEQALIRELWEETRVKVNVEKLLYHYQSTQQGKIAGEQYFYLCNYLSGKVSLGASSIEKARMENNEQLYKPQWVILTNLPQLLLYPLEIRDWLLKDYVTEFMHTPRHVTFEVSE